MEIQFLNHYIITNEILDLICEIKDENWPYGIVKQKKWIEENIQKDDVHVLVFDDEQKLIGYTNLVYRTLVINESVTTSIFGIGNVCVSNQSKKSGIGKFMMLEINKYIILKNIPGLLFCKDNLIPFYLKCGWNLLDPSKISCDFNMTDINSMIFNYIDILNLKIIGKSF